jgi:protoporphyrinogen oxidase
MAYDPLPYSKNVEKHILECIQGGVGIREMLASMQHLQAAPKSLSTLYKIYGTIIHSERARINAAVGRKVIDQALEGDFKSQELFLRSKGGWSPKETIETTEGIDEDTDESAVDALMTLLGFNSDDPTTEETDSRDTP